MLISRQGVGGGRAQTHYLWGECRTGSWMTISATPVAALNVSPGAKHQTTFRRPGASAMIDKEVAV